jgi:hypothetical protein
MVAGQMMTDEETAVSVEYYTNSAADWILEIPKRDLSGDALPLASVRATAALAMANAALALAIKEQVAASR